ncbi:hypothetical protein LEWO105114_03215 [Legionella worsleiensis]|nr:Uncharacterised protein [Legionella worsleiensis]
MFTQLILYIFILIYLINNAFSVRQSIPSV